MLTISNKHSIDIKRSKRKNSTEFTHQQSSQIENLIEKKKTQVVRYSNRNALTNYFVRYIEFLNSPCVIFYYDTVIDLM